MNQSYSLLPMLRRCSTSASGRSVISSLRVIFRRFGLDALFASKNKLFATLSRTDERTMMGAWSWCHLLQERMYATL